MKEQGQKANQLHTLKYSKRNFLTRGFKKILTLLKYTLRVFYISKENYEEAASSTMTINSKKKLLKNTIGPSTSCQSPIQ